MSVMQKTENGWKRADSKNGIAMEIYDSNERMIGMYEGKPLYRKTIDYGYGSETTGSYIYKAHGINNIDKVVKLSGCIKFASGQFSALPFVSSTALNSQVSIVSDATNVGYMSNAPRATDYFVFIIEYTKTTDSPIDINRLDIISQNMYDGEEHQIGMWFGKPLYQKVVSFNPTSVMNTEQTHAHGIANIDTIARFDGYIDSGVVIFHLPQLYFTSSVQTGGCYTLYMDKTNFTFIQGNNRSSWVVRVIVQYTKTTD